MADLGSALANAYNALTFITDKSVDFSKAALPALSAPFLSPLAKHNSLSLKQLKEKNYNCHY